MPLHEPVDVEAVERFIRSTCSFPDALVSVARMQPDDVVVNVRRGDYYSDPEIRRQYGSTS